MKSKQINRKLKEKFFENHFCDKLEDNDFRKRLSENTEKEFHVDLEILEEFLVTTQENEFNMFKEAYPASYHEKLLQSIEKEFQKKEFIQIIQDGLSIEGRYSFDLCYTKNATDLNKEQDKLVQSNIFSYIRQYDFELNPKTRSKSIDIVLFLNGFPITTLELKYKPKKQSVYNAVDQYLDRDLSNHIFKFPFLHVAADNDEAKITTKFKTRTTKDFMPFNKDLINPVVEDDPYRVEYLYNDIFTKDSILDLIRNFVFVDKDNKIICPRYHQRRAIKKILADVIDKFSGNKSLNLKYLIEHSAGSGKSKSITWSAERLMNLYVKKEKVFDSVIVITDRVDLHENVKKDFKKKLGDLETIAYVKNSKELKEAIMEDTKKLIVVVLHNFKYLDSSDMDNQKNKRVCFIIDEAHRSQEGKLHSSMNDFFEKFGDPDDNKFVYPNSAFIAFTATPSDKTLKRFGLLDKNDNRLESFDTYSMEQAIKEEYILDVSVNVVPYVTLYKLKSEEKDKTLDEEFHALTLYKQLKKKVFEDPEVISKKVNIISHYFDTKIKQEINGKAKCMIVSTSRKAAIAYKILLDKAIEKAGLPYKTLVAFSGKESHKDLKIKDVTEKDLNGQLREKSIPDEFHEHDECKFLIVADKYQTGFDEPLLHAMFLDKSLSNPITAVQTLSRLNRIAPYKTNLPLTVDFSNSHENIQKAFAKFLRKRETQHSETLEDLNTFYENIIGKNIVTVKDLEEYDIISTLDEDIFQTKFEIFQNKIKDIYDKKDKVTKGEFRQNLRRYVSTYEYLNSFSKIPNRNQILLALFGELFNEKISEEGASTADLKKAIEKIKIEKPKVAPAKESEIKGEGKKRGISIKYREVAKLTINDIIDVLNESFELHAFTKENRELFEEYLKTIVADENIRKKILNTPEGELRQTKVLLKEELEGKIQNHFFFKGYDFYEQYKDEGIFEKANELAIQMLIQERNMF